MSISVRQIKSKLDPEMNFFEPGVKYAGIDIGSSLVKIAVIKEAAIGTRLLGVGIAEIPPAAESETVDTSAQRVALAIKNALKQIKVPVKKVSTIINSPSLAIKNLSLPAMPDAELSESLKWEMGQNITYPIEEATLDFLVSGETITAGARNLELEVITVQRNEVDAHLAFFELQQMNVRAITISSFCLWNVFQKSNQWNESDTIALLDFGAKTTRITVYNNMILRFTREIFFGENTVLQAMMSSHGISEEEARKSLSDYGLEDNSPYYDAIAQCMQKLTSELDRSFGYYKAQFHVERINCLMFYGGGSRIPNLEKFMSEALGLFAEVGNPFNGLLFDKTAFENFEDFFPYFTMAIGAALASGTAKNLNLLPPELKKNTEGQWKKVVVRLIPVAIILIFIGLYVEVITREKALTREKQEQERIIATWKGQTELEQKIKFLSSIPVTQDSWTAVLKNISMLIPEKVWLSSITLTEKTKLIVLMGASESNHRVIDFVRRLERAPVFRAVSLISVEEQQAQDSPGIYFRIEARKK